MSTFCQGQRYMSVFASGSRARRSTSAKWEGLIGSGQTTLHNSSLMPLTAWSAVAYVNEVLNATVFVASERRCSVDQRNGSSACCSRPGCTNNIFYVSVPLFPHPEIYNKICEVQEKTVGNKVAGSSQLLRSAALERQCCCNSDR